MILAAKVSAHHAAHDALKAYQKSISKDPLAPFLASLEGGDAAKGSALFATHPAAQCARCHDVDPQFDPNRMVGPNLSDIGQKSPRALLEALVRPSATLARGYRALTLILTEGKTVSGTLIAARPDYFDLRVNGETLRIATDEIAKVHETPSPMPAMGSLLAPEEIRDLVAYLGTLKIAPSNKKPLAQEPKRHHPSSIPN